MRKLERKSGLLEKLLAPAMMLTPVVRSTAVVLEMCMYHMKPPPHSPTLKMRGGGGVWHVALVSFVLVCSWRRLLADRHSLPFPWTLTLHRRWCPSASHHPVPFQAFGKA